MQRKMVLLGTCREMESPSFSITFGERVENHAGMQMIGELAEEGFTKADLELALQKLTERGLDGAIVDLVPPEGSGVPNGYVLIVKGALQSLGDTSHDEAHDKLLGLSWDTKAKMRGRVVNKRARYNLCFAESDQEPEYAEGKGRVMSFSSVTFLETLRASVHEVLGVKAKDLYAEGNYYYSEDCGIGFHGDSERRIVIAFCLGRARSLCYQWFLETKPVGKRVDIDMSPGDMYVMAGKAVGTDWKRRKIATLRHASGSLKYISLCDKKELVDMTRREMLEEMRIREKEFKRLKCEFPEDADALGDEELLNILEEFRVVREKAKAAREKAKEAREELRVMKEKAKAAREER